MSVESQRHSYMPDEQTFVNRLHSRHRRGGLWRVFFTLSTLVALVALVALFMNIVNGAFGYAISQYNVPINEIAPDGDLSQLNDEQLVGVLLEYEPGRIPVIVRDNLSRVPAGEFTSTPISEVLAGSEYPDEIADQTMTTLQEQGIRTEVLAGVLLANSSRDQLLEYVEEEVLGDEEILETWSLSESLTQRGEIERIAEEEYPEARLYFRAWLNLGFLTTPGSSIPWEAGVSVAIQGTLLLIVLTIGVAFPIGVGAALYLEEYADRTKTLNRLIETNIRNLAGVPSIIYGLLGLAIFVRAFVGVTQGRTLISAGLTMALLVLPVVIINAQEALRAVPSSLREASYGMGATKWQTIWKVVLPSAMPGILTGTILAMSRAVGETAPLVIIGASTFLTAPSINYTSGFTALPIQIYQWTARPQDEYRDIAAAAIIVLLVLLLLLNATAIILRQRFRRSLSA